jgi:uncharacterized surface protein with fasciclin (FAS1) repeats
LIAPLRGKGPFTVFAPTDSAFAKLPDGKLEELYDLATELDSIEIHALAIDIREALGR